MARPRLSLVLPDYAIFFANELNRGFLPDRLKQSITRARFRADESSYVQRLLSLFAETKLEGNDLPLAQIRGGSLNSLCADPCYLHPDRDQLLLFYRDLDLSLDEAKAFSRRLQPLLSELNARLIVQDADSWLLECDQLPAVDFTARDGLHGRPVTDCLPTGKDAQTWIRLWNEIQMLLFECPENVIRETAGKVPINGLWFWGKAMMPSWRAWSHVSGDAALLKNLAETSGSNYRQNISEFDQIKASQALHIITFDPERDWDGQWDVLMNHWLLPAMRALKQWRLSELELIIPEWGDYKLTFLTNWYFWR